MSDRDIIDTIADDFTNEIVGNSSDCNGGRLTLRRSRDLAAQALAALHAAGYAIVKLPEGDSFADGDWSTWRSAIAPSSLVQVRVYGDGGMVLTPGGTRQFAAALLAAADAAEEGQVKPGLGLEHQVREFARVNRELIAERDHWKALWRQNTATAAEAMRERDQALAENARLTEQLATRTTITSDKQLDALPEFAVLRYSYTSRAGLRLHEIWERLPGGWYCIGGATSPPSGDYGVPTLPAQLIWHPDDWETNP